MTAQDSNDKGDVGIVACGTSAARRRVVHTHFVTIEQELALLYHTVCLSGQLICYLLHDTTPIINLLSFPWRTSRCHKVRFSRMHQVGETHSYRQKHHRQHPHQTSLPLVVHQLGIRRSPLLSSGPPCCHRSCIDVGA